MSSPSNIPYATDKASAIVRCIQHAVGDGIKEATHGLKTKNGRIGTLWDIMASYDPKQYGWQHAPELAPYFNFGANAKTGAKMAQPVKKL